MQPPVKTTTPAQLGAAIRLLREAQGTTIEDLAADAKIHWTYLSGIENGKRNPSWIVVNKLAGALGAGVGEIADLAGKQSPRRR